VLLCPVWRSQYTTAVHFYSINRYVFDGIKFCSLSGTNFIYLFSTTHCSLLRLIVRSGLDVPTFATRRLHACHDARAPTGGRWNCGREMSRKVCLKSDFYVTFRDLLHAVKLRHGIDGFTSPPKKGVLSSIFSP
jgi:hypothetical protein